MDTCELDFTCPNPRCEFYKTAIEVRCRIEPLNVTTPEDDRDLDCVCGDRLIQTHLLGCESYTPDEIARRQAVGA